jgi:hypothetical protein
MNNKGSILFISILIVAAISVIAATVVFTRSLGLVKVGRTYRMQIENSQLSHELEVIFANPKLCASLLVISGDTFRVGEIFKAPFPGAAPIPLKSNSSMGIKKMLVENITSVTTSTGVLQQADFSIITQDLGDLKSNNEVKNTVSALYLPGSGGAVTDCRIKIDAASACAELGFTWSTTASHCQMCEKMGGTWGSDSKCTLAASGQ